MLVNPSDFLAVWARAQTIKYTRADRWKSSFPIRPLYILFCSYLFTKCSQLIHTILKYECYTKITKKNLTSQQENFFIKQSPAVTLPLYRASPLPKIPRKQNHCFRVLLFKKFFQILFCISRTFLCKRADLLHISFIVGSICPYRQIS